MTSPRSRNDIRLDRVIVRLRQVDRDLYRLTATIGRAIEYEGGQRWRPRLRLPQIWQAVEIS
jgi:hypothetical protein